MGNVHVSLDSLIIGSILYANPVLQSNLYVLLAPTTLMPAMLTSSSA